jgi:hypothetical protein
MMEENGLNVCIGAGKLTKLEINNQILFCNHKSVQLKT